MNYESPVSVVKWDNQPPPHWPLQNITGFARITELVLGSPGGAVALFAPY